MTRIVYLTATTLDGYLADEQDSLDWLFVVDGGQESLAETEEFTGGVGVMVEGCSTYLWLVEHEDLLAHPEKWQEFHGPRRTYVFTSRPDEMPRIPGADITFVSGPVADLLPDLRAAADGKDVWVVGGGDLAAQFAAAGALDELHVSIAPVLLGAGKPLFTGRWESDRLHLVSCHATGQFVQARYRLVGS